MKVDGKSYKSGFKVLVGAALLGTVGLAAHYARMQTRPTPPVDEPTAKHSQAPQEITRVTHPPVDLATLSGHLNPNAVALTAEQIRSDENLITSQIADAAESLRSIDSNERIGGAEQLAAYPTREAENLLVEALQTDMEAEVRATAATSLMQVRKPGRKTVSALLSALADENEDVRDAVLETLTFHIQHLEPDSTAYKQLLAELKKVSSSKRVPKSTREEIRDFLADQ